MTKPIAKLIGEDGNVFNLLGICSRALKLDGKREEAKEMQERVWKCNSYADAINTMGEYVDII